MKHLLLFFTINLAITSYAQNVGVGTTKPKNKLHVAGGLRVDSLGNKDSGIVLHNSHGDLVSLPFTGRRNDVLRGDGTFFPMINYQASNAVSESWLTAGNGETDTAIHFVGTTDNMPLRFKVNNIRAGELNNANYNTSYGYRSLLSATTGQRNTATGGEALSANSTGNYNSGYGYGALAANTSGSYNTAVGYLALSLNTTATTNTALGATAMYRNTTGDDNVAVGYRSLHFNTSGSTNVALGKYSLEANTTGSANSAVGFNALADNVTGYSNTAQGTNALRNNTTGFSNVAIGAGALFKNKLGRQMVAIGDSALFNEVGDPGFMMYENVAVGSKAMFENTDGFANVAVGFQAMYSGTSRYSIAVGMRSLYSADGSDFCTAVGYGALYDNTTGEHNTGFGYHALDNNTTGTGNTAVGASADVSVGNLNNATAIGAGANVNASNKVRIGNASVTKIEGQVPFTTPSDGRYKFNVQENVKGLSFIMKLRPVTYQFDVKRFQGLNANVSYAGYDEAQQLRRTGFIAQEVEQAAKESEFPFSGIGSPEKENEYYSLSYESFVVPLVKAMQEQQHLIMELRAEIEELKAKNNRRRK